MIHISQLKKSFSSDFTLKIDDLHIEKGNRIALIGPNGSGKSTLLKLLAGQLKADSGKIICNAKKGDIGYQPQSPYAFRGSAEYNIRISPGAPNDISHILKICELEALADKKMPHLSGGEKQRVFLARMLAGDFNILLLDEPLSWADIQTASRLSGVIRDECENKNKTMVFSTHLPRQAFDIADKFLLLDGGNIAEFGSVEQMKSPESDFGRAFFSLWRV